MLDSIRNAARSWLVKLLLSVLVVSFALWGVSDVFRGATEPPLIEAGGTKITEQTFTAAFDRQVQDIGRRSGQAFTREQAALFGFDRIVLNRFVTEAVLDETARRMGLGRSDEAAVREILETSGLDPATLRERLRDNNVSEQQFILSERQAAIRRQISEGLAGETSASDVLIEALHRFQDEKRRVSYLSFGAQALGEPPKPDQAALEAYHKDNKSSFRAPEYRTFSVLRLDVASVAKAIQVTDEDARRFYEAQKAQYTTPERRSVDQIVFDAEEEARAALERIKTGAAPFEAVAIERKLAIEDVSLGLVTQAEILNRPVADAAFALQAGAISEPVKTDFGWALVRVTQIAPGAVKTFEEVQAEVKAKIASDRAGREITDTYNRVDDERAGGASLADIAGRFKIDLRRFEALDRQGRAQNGVAVENGPDSPVLSAAFEAQVGLETNAVSLGRDGYAWVELEAVIPARERPLDEVRDDAARRWTEQEIKSRLNDLAAAVLKEIEGGKTLEAVATEKGIELKEAGPFRRTESPEPFSDAAVKSVFATAQGRLGQALAQDGASRIVFRVADIALEPLAAEARAPFATQAENALSEDLLSQYVTWAQNEIGVRINQATLARILGRSQS